MIRVHNLTKYYGDHPAIQGISFEVGDGEIVGFLGPNGAGKSTTMRILAGFLPPTSGVAEVAGYNVFTHSLEARRHLGYLPENVPLYPEMSVRGYLDFVAKIKGVARAVRRERVDHVMDVTRVGDVADRLIAKLSKGYRQRVGLAQALLGDPKVLILDEPTVGLDPKQIIETRNLIKSLGGSHTVILSTHILPEVSMTCGRVMIINEGRIVAVDTPENLTRRLQGADTVQLEVRGPREAVERQLRRVEGVLSVEVRSTGDGRNLYTVTCGAGKDVREKLAAAIVNGGWGLQELRPVGLSLEEIFLKLTTSEAT